MLEGWISFQTTHPTILGWYLIPPLPYTDFSNLGWAWKRINQSRDFLCPWGGNGFRMPPRRVRRRLIWKVFCGGLHFSGSVGFWHFWTPGSDSRTLKSLFFTFYSRNYCKNLKGLDFRDFGQFDPKSRVLQKVNLICSVSFWFFWSKWSTFLLF